MDTFNKYINDSIRNRLIENLSAMKLERWEEKVVIDFFYTGVYDPTHAGTIKRIGFALIKNEFDKVSNVFSKTINSLELMNEAKNVRVKFTRKGLTRGNFKGRSAAS